MVGKEAQGSLCKQFLRPCLSPYTLLIDRNSRQNSISVEQDSWQDICSTLYFREHLTYCYWSAHADLQTVAKSTDSGAHMHSSQGLGTSPHHSVKEGVCVCITRQYHVTTDGLYLVIWEKETHPCLLLFLLLWPLIQIIYQSLLFFRWAFWFIYLCSNPSKQLPRSVTLQDVWESFPHSFTLEKSAALRFEKLSSEKRIERQELHHKSEV